VNARDAMPQGGKIAIGTQNVALVDGQVGRLAQGPYVKVSVTDTGSGMSPEVQSRAFEPFFTTKEIGKGTGLGLSQVYGFIAQCRGDIRLTSKVGDGTTVDIYLPTIDDSPNAEEPAKDGYQDTVLIVDDDPEIVDVAAELFRTIGYEVITAQSGPQAVAVLKQRSDIDVLFADVMMPGGMNGIQLAHAAKILHPAIKVILASGYPLPAVKAEGGLDDFPLLNKPYRLSDIARKLRAVK